MVPCRGKRRRSDPPGGDVLNGRKRAEPELQALVELRKGIPISAKMYLGGEGDAGALCSSD